MKKIAIVQPIVNEYRTGFIRKLSKNVELDLYSYVKKELAILNGFKFSSHISSQRLKSFSIGSFLIYNFLPLLNKNYKYIIVIGNVKHISVWILLVLGKVLRIKIILWGHGISMTRYIDEYKKLPLIRILMYQLAYGAWFYTSVELQLYKKKIKNLAAVSLNNTISEVDDIINIKPLDVENKLRIKNKYKIKSKYNLIICTRFESPYRKADELLDIMKGLKQSWGLIIIGDGKYKPDFSEIINVYDFGSVYERDIKSDLFLISDLYIQLGHVGLSIVEAFAYRLPVITLKRSSTTHHSVEYSYISDNRNGFLCNDLNDVIDRINTVDKETLKEMGNNAVKYVIDNLNSSNMSSRALSIII